MRQHDRLTALLFLAWAIVAGCRSFDAYPTAATAEVLSSRPNRERSRGTADVAAVQFALYGQQGAHAPRSPIALSPGWIRRAGHRTEASGSASAALVGVITDVPQSSRLPELTGTLDVHRAVHSSEMSDRLDTSDEIVTFAPIEASTASSDVNSTGAQEPIDLPPLPESDPTGGWGHTTPGEAGLIPCPACETDGPFRVSGPEPVGSAGWTRPTCSSYPPPLCTDGWVELANHQIRVGDELEIKFPHKPLFSEQVMVREDGMISLPLIESVMAAGLTPEQLQQTLSERYRALQYDPLAARAGPVEKKYLLSVGDKLEVRFDTERPDPQLSQLGDSVTVRPDGRISLPLIGTVVAEGKTPEELEAEVAALYRQYYKEADPVLIVREFTNDRVLVDGEMKRTGLKNIDDVVVLTRKFERLVFVGGEVVRPGFVKLAGPMTVTQAILAAGGPKRSAELRTVAMFREGPYHRAEGRLLNLNCRFTYENQKRIPPEQRLALHDVPLAANDVVIVPKTMISKVGDTLDQYVYQLIPMTRNTSFQYVYTTGSSLGFFGF